MIITLRYTHLTPRSNNQQVGMFPRDSQLWKFKRSRSGGKQMAASVFERDGHFVTVPLQDRRTVNGDTTVSVESSKPGDSSAWREDLRGSMFHQVKRKCPHCWSDTDFLATNGGTPDPSSALFTGPLPVWVFPIPTHQKATEMNQDERADLAVREFTTGFETTLRNGSIVGMLTTSSIITEQQTPAIIVHCAVVSSPTVSATKNLLHLTEREMHQGSRARTKEDKRGRRKQKESICRKRFTRSARSRH